MSRRAVVTGAAGFVGGHLVNALKQGGNWVRGVDIRCPETTTADEFEVLDLRRPEHAMLAVRGAQDVYALAADMGGMGYIAANHATIMRDNTLIDVNTFEAARLHGVRRFLYPSSACVYPSNALPLKETDAFPAQPEEAYGWEKLFGELLLRYGSEQWGIATRIARLHNIYGPGGAWRGGREKAPAALCRKVAQAHDGGTVEIWGDGRQSRSFCYIDDCVQGLLRLMESGHREPLNLGSDRLVTINELARIIIAVSGKRDLSLVHVPGPQGVRLRNSDNAKLREVLGWSPQVSLESGISLTYQYISERVREKVLA